MRHGAKNTAIRFFKQAQQTIGVKPTCVITDKLASTRKTIRKACGRKVLYRTSKYLNICIEQDHRGIKRRYSPTWGFKSIACAATLCAAVDEVRQSFRTRQTMKETISLAQGRQHFRQSVTDFQQFFPSCPG